MGIIKHYGDQDKAKEAIDAVMKDKLPYWLKKFEARLEENEKRGNKNGFFVGDSISIADFKFYDSLSLTEEMGLLEQIKKDYKGIAALREQFKKNVEDMKTNKNTVFKYAGKFVQGDL